MSTKLAARVAYVGREYCGWQRQPSENNLPSIQEKLETVLGQIFDQKTNVVASGRTDAGVNAVGQVVHFWCPNAKLTPETLRRALNTYLPSDIRVMGVAEVPEDFHAQRSATQKQYSYYFQQGPCALPHLRDTSWWIHRELNVDAMKAGLAYILGEHDFKAFQGRKPAFTKSTVRSILEAEVTREPLSEMPGRDLNESGFALVRMRLVGVGFLKHMVRGIAGTLLQIGEEKRPPEDMQRILLTQDRTLMGATAPSKGLTLERVWYKPDLLWKIRSN